MTKAQKEEALFAIGYLHDCISSKPILLSNGFTILKDDGRWYVQRDGDTKLYAKSVKDVFAYFKSAIPAFLAAKLA